ncbi:MAG TPA: STAS domain-containing protein [Candidatus Limnocylindria bacterium]|jgi:anti-anti-sigma factor|nr:STAS domain-containing protein [Candidatus Limnocylindria bacterium]
MSNSLPSSDRTEHALVHESLDRAEVLHVFGEVDIFTAPDLESAIAASVRIGRLLVVNLLECRYIDSTVIALLMRAQKALGNRLRVVSAETGTVRRVLTLTEVDRVLRVTSTLADALRG